MLRNRFKVRENSTANVGSILLAALLFGLAAGFPAGYFARQLYAESPESNLASLQQR
jgi:hypothetical protein